MNDDELERILRAALNDRAEHAPDPDELTRRVLADIDLDGAGDPVRALGPVLADVGDPARLAARAAERSRQRRRTRLLVPLASVASVAAVVGLGLAVTRHEHASTNTAAEAAAQSSRAAESRTKSPTAAPGRSTGSVELPTAGVSNGSAPSIDSTDAVPLPTGFQAVDLSYVGPSAGFALGTVPCSGGRCAALARSTVPTQWTLAQGSLPFAVQTPSGVSTSGAVPSATGTSGTASTTTAVTSGSSSTEGSTSTANSGSADGSSASGGGSDPSTGSTEPVVEHIRFATATQGYAYGPSALFVTSDGGVNWADAGSSARALEVADDTVVRVAATDCTDPNCTYVLSVAQAGTVDFSPVTVAGADLVGTDVSLARAGKHVFVAVTTATGLGETLLSSDDGGRSWTTHAADLCGGESGNTVPAQVGALAAASDGSVTALCTAAVAQYTVTSIDSGAHFTVGAPITSERVDQVASATAKVLLVGGPTVYRSTDSGRSWSPVDGLPTLTDTDFLGFQNTKMGRWVGGTGSSVWTTQDAGASFIESSFG